MMTSNSEFRANATIIRALEDHLTNLRDITMERMRSYADAKDTTLAEAMEVLVYKIDEITEEIRNIHDKMLQALSISIAAKDKVVKFNEFLQKLMEFISQLSKRSVLISKSSLNDKCKIWHLELGILFQDMITSICLIYEELATHETMLVTSNRTNKSVLSLRGQSIASPIVRNNLGQLSSSSLHDLPDVPKKEPPSPEAIQLLEEIRNSAQELRLTLDNYLRELKVRHPQIDEKSRQGITLDGMTHLVAHIDSSVDELRMNEEKILESMTAAVSVMTNAVNFNRTMLEFIDFFKDFDKKMYYSFKSNVKKKLQLNNLIFSTRSNHFITSVCLNVNLTTPPPKKTTTPHYDDGIKYSYGIGAPRNLNLAYAFFLEGAEDNDSMCQEKVAQCYWKGLGVDSDIDAAQKWLQRAMSQGLSSARCSMALLLVSEVQDSDIDAEDREVIMQHALTLLFNAASDEDIDAMTNLGVVFEKAQEFEEAEKWYSKAAASGCCRALNLLGLMQFNGKGSYSRKRLGRGDGLGEKKLAFLSFCAAAKGGCANAYYNVGNCLEYGIGTDVDILKAIASYRVGSDLGCPMAMYSLGYLLLKQELVKFGELEKNSVEYVTRTSILHRNLVLDEGIKYLRAAYEHGIVEAAYQLGRMYELAPQYDYKYALQPYLWAAEKGHNKAAYCAANILYMYGDGSSKDRIKGESFMYLQRAYELYNQAAEAGIIDSMNSIGLLLEGEEIFTISKEADLALAAQWYFEASNTGLEEAILNLSLLLASGRLRSFITFSGVPMSMDAALEWLNNQHITKEYLQTKFGFALRRIEVLAQGELITKSSNKRKDSLTLLPPPSQTSEGPVKPSKPTRPPSKIIDSEHTLLDSEYVPKGALLKPPRSSSVSRLIPDMSPVRTNRPGGYAVESPVSRNIVDVGTRESLATSPYSGLKPLSKQYEALATATTYDEFIDILASDEAPQTKLSGTRLVHERAISNAKHHSHSITKLAF